MEHLFESYPHIKFDLITNVKFDKIYFNYVKNKYKILLLIMKDIY